MGKFLERTPLVWNRILSLWPICLLSMPLMTKAICVFWMLRNLQMTRWNLLLSLPFVPCKDSSTLISTAQQIAKKCQKTKTITLCVQVCVYVSCWQRSKPMVKMKERDTFRFISNNVSWLKPPLIHLIRINLPPDSSTGYLYLRFLYHIIFMCCMSTSPPN